MRLFGTLFLILFSSLAKASESELIDAAEGAPKHITAYASYMVWSGDKFVQKLKGSNEFVCLVLQDSKGRFEPTCLNRAAMKSVFPVYEYQTQLLQKGEDISDIHKAIESKFKQGEFEAPLPGALVYMMSKRNKFYDHFNQRLVNVGPHIMLYLPKQSESSLGLNGENGLPGFYNEYPHMSVIHISTEYSSKN